MIKIVFDERDHIFDDTDDTWWLMSVSGTIDRPLAVIM